MLKVATENDVVMLDGNSLTLHDVVKVARNNIPVKLHPSGKDKLVRSRHIIEDIVNNKQTVYGVTTGFGKFSDVTIPKSDVDALQKNIIKSHSCGVGEPLPAEVVRAMMLLRANSLVKGFSGVRVEVVELILDMLNNGVHPVVPCKGSVGASGDLAPLSHIALAMIGLGEVVYEDKLMPAAEAFKKAGLQPLSLTAKEGLALINGTQYMSALGSLALWDAKELWKVALIAATMSFEALEGIPSALDPQVHMVRPHNGQMLVAQWMLRLLSGSELLERVKHNRVQDAYSLRCIPQVHGASLDALGYIENVLNIEINSASDNPLIFPETGDVISGGNFHGEPLALALDFLSIAMSKLGNISERRIERLVNPALNGNLPAFLTEHGGLNSGLMILQYTAAALVSENKVLAHPASVDSIPTSGNQEDIVSMGSIAAYKARTVVENVSWIVAGEVLAACQALDFVSHRIGKASQAVLSLVRKQVPHWEEDRILYKDLETVHNMVISGQIRDEVEKAVGLCF